jgi:hypothetical protein
MPRSERYLSSGPGLLWPHYGLSHRAQWLPLHCIRTDWDSPSLAQMRPRGAVENLCRHVRQSAGFLDERIVTAVFDDEVSVWKRRGCPRRIPASGGNVSATLRLAASVLDLSLDGCLACAGDGPSQAGAIVWGCGDVEGAAVAFGAVSEVAESAGTCGVCKPMPSSSTWISRSVAVMVTREPDRRRMLGQVVQTHRFRMSSEPAGSSVPGSLAHLSFLSRPSGSMTRPVPPRPTGQTKEPIERKLLSLHGTTTPGLFGNRLATDMP